MKPSKLRKLKRIAIAQKQNDRKAIERITKAQGKVWEEYRFKPYGFSFKS